MPSLTWSLRLKVSVPAFLVLHRYKKNLSWMYRPNMMYEMANMSIVIPAISYNCSSQLKFHTCEIRFIENRNSSDSINIIQWRPHLMLMQQQHVGCFSPAFSTHSAGISLSFFFVRLIWELCVSMVCCGWSGYIICYCPGSIVIWLSSFFIFF